MKTNSKQTLKVCFQILTVKFSGKKKRNGNNERFTRCCCGVKTSNKTRKISNNVNKVFRIKIDE